MIFSILAFGALIISIWIGYNKLDKKDKDML